MKKSRMVVKVCCVDDKSQQSYFDCVSLIRACLKHEMTKWRNGEITILNSKKKNDSLYFVVSSCYFFAFYEPAKLCSACWCKTSQILLCHRRYRSHLFFLVPRISPFPRDFPVLSVSATSPPPGGGEVLDWNLTQFRTKNPLINALFRTTPSILLHCLGQRTKCTPSYFKAIYWQLQSRNFHVIVIAFVCK